MVVVFFDCLGVEICWYGDVVGVQLFYIGSQFIFFGLSSSQQFWVEACIGGCVFVLILVNIEVFVIEFGFSISVLVLFLGEFMIFQVVVQQVGYIYIWFFGDGGSVFGLGLYDYIYLLLGIFEVIFQVESLEGCVVNIF